MKAGLFPAILACVWLFGNDVCHATDSAVPDATAAEAVESIMSNDDLQSRGDPFMVDRTSKKSMPAMPATLYDTSAIVWAVNVGGGAHIGIDGVRYQPDEFVSGGEIGVIDTVVGAQDGEVYKSYRIGDLKISRPLENGVYDITFQFAEPHDDGIGERVFDVLAQGNKVIDALDVRRTRSGSHLSALRRTVTGVVVRDGQLDIQFAATSSTPFLNGLVVRQRKPDSRTWKLEWADEFDYVGAPDPSKWTAEIWDPRRVNDEDQAYTDREKNVRVEDGRLILEAHREAYGDASYTSARILSKGKGDFLYGRVDIRARLPSGQGTWPALWMLPSDPYRYATNCRTGDEWLGIPSCNAWPNSGEIDIMEHVGYDMKRVHGTVHNHTFHGGRREQRSGSIELADVDQAFHVYSLDWTPQYIDIFVDGILYYSYFNEGTGWQDWPFDHPFHLIMNLAIGGWWGRDGGPIDNGIFPTRMEVDYVRVFTDAAAAVGKPSVVAGP